RSFKNKINQAYSVRKPLLLKDVNAYRLLFGENDGMPGLIVDIYNRVGVVKVYSAIWIPYIETLLKPIVGVSGVEALIIRWSRNVQSLKVPYKEREVIFGEQKNSQVKFKEYGVHVEKEIVIGDKTGL